MEKFVENAFKDALAAMNDEEYDAYSRHIVDDDNGSVINTAVALNVGIEKVDRMLAAMDDEAIATLSEYIANTMLISFHIGYNARREDER